MEKSSSAKERVQIELYQLIEKINKLTTFLFGEAALELTKEMRFVMRDQLRAMEEYASCLQHRLEIWNEPENQLVPESHYE